MQEKKSDKDGHIYPFFRLVQLSTCLSVHMFQLKSWWNLILILWQWRPSKIHCTHNCQEVLTRFIQKLRTTPHLAPYEIPYTLAYSLSSILPLNKNNSILTSSLYSIYHLQHVNLLPPFSASWKIMIACKHKPECWVSFFPHSFSHQRITSWNH